MFCFLIKRRHGTIFLDRHYFVFLCFLEKDWWGKKVFLHFRQKPFLKLGNVADYWLPIFSFTTCDMSKCLFVGGFRRHGKVDPATGQVEVHLALKSDSSWAKSQDQVKTIFLMDSVDLDPESWSRVQREPEKQAETVVWTQA